MSIDQKVKVSLHVPLHAFLICLKLALSCLTKIYDCLSQQISIEKT